MKHESGNYFLFTGSEERITRLLGSLRVGVLLQGPNSEILFCNKVAIHMLGLTKDELSGRFSFNPEWSVIHEDGSPFPDDTHPVRTAIITKAAVSNVIMGIHRPITNDNIWLLANAEPLLNENDEVSEVICSFSNITERKFIEEKLRWLYQSLEVRALELATSNAEMEQFLYVATHDLQEPLRMVNSFTQLLKKKYGKQLDEQANEYINYAVEGASRMKKLILDLLQYSKFRSNCEKFAPTDMQTVLNIVSQSFSAELKETAAELKVAALPVISASTSLMVQLFENLIGNALKYRSDQNPQIHITCKEEADNFLFSVIDNGIGIDPKYADKIFILFRRLHNDNETYKGTGVGLAICKKIIELHRGNIWVEPGHGKGSRFYFTIAKEQKNIYEKL